MNQYSSRHFPELVMLVNWLQSTYIHELNAVKFAELHSPAFPPQVFVDEKGIIEPMKNEFYYLKSHGEDKKDYIILVGNTQGLSPEGQYEYVVQLLILLANTV